MGEYSFKSDLIIAEWTEKEISKLLKTILDYETVSFNKDNKYDILCIDSESNEFTIEIKEDFMAAKTYNVAVEFESRGKSSGISKSKSDYYLYKIHLSNGMKSYYIIETKKLKSMIKFNLYSRIVSGGDKGSNTKMYIFPILKFISYAKHLEVPSCIDYVKESGESKKCKFYEAIKSNKGYCKCDNSSKDVHFLCEYTLKYMSNDELKKILNI